MNELQPVPWYVAMLTILNCEFDMKLPIIRIIGLSKIYVYIIIALIMKLIARSSAR